jgi:hypothetical protein
VSSKTTLLGVEAVEALNVEPTTGCGPVSSVDLATNDGISGSEFVTA